MTSVTVIPDKPPVKPTTPVIAELPAYRGFKLGATLFGWLIMVSMAVLITAAIAGAAVGIASVLDYTRADVENKAGTAAITAAGLLVLMACLTFYIGGYVAGRLARFDGARQGFGVWMFSLLLAVLAAGVGAYANSLYDLVGRVDRPDVPLTNNDLLTGGLVTAAAVLMLPLLAALLGGKTGQRYHDRIDDMLD
jgi:Mg2+/citrate symporter